MAKNSAGKTGGPSRIRFIMVEAELAEGDIGQVTQAIQNALRGPSTVTTQRIAGPAPTKAIESDAMEVELEADLEEEPSAEHSSTARPSRPRGHRKPPPTPEVIEIDVDADVALRTFAAQSNPQSHTKRFLVVAAWFKLHRSLDSIGTSHVYTCYMSLKWPTDLQDFYQPFRQLKKNKLMTHGEEGLYSINHIGLQRVREMAGGSKD